MLEFVQLLKKKLLAVAQSIIWVSVCS